MSTAGILLVLALGMGTITVFWIFAQEDNAAIIGGIATVILLVCAAISWII